MNMEAKNTQQGCERGNSEGKGVISDLCVLWSEHAILA